MPAATLLVVQAEGTGVPRVPPPTEAPSVRLATGQKRPKKKAAVVTGLSTSAPDPRTPQDLVATLVQDADRPEPTARPQPVAKALQATLAGQAVAMSRRAPRAAQRQGPHRQPRVARTEGAEALPQHVVTHGPAHPLVLDLIHATASWWDTATALLGESHPPRPAWVRADLEPRRAGQTDAVITALAAAGKAPACTGAPRQAVHRTVGSYRRHRPSMRDDKSLAQGWPIGTGVIEGACGPLVKDRLEPSGRRWTPAGAQAGLDRRAVRLNGPWDRSWPCHRPQPHHPLDGRPTPAPALAEAQALEWAA